MEDVVDLPDVAVGDGAVLDAGHHCVGDHLGNVGVPSASPSFLASMAMKGVSRGPHEYVVYSVGVYSVGVYSVGVYSVGVYSVGVYSVGVYPVLLDHLVRISGVPA